MKITFAIVVLCIMAVTCPSGTESVPVESGRPVGCSPGCGPQEICAELGQSYCRPGHTCSVCIKMD